MISIVCVYNNEGLLKRILLPSLKKQTAGHELILVNNTSTPKAHGRFISAASALNHGGKQANGKYILFVHQDIELGSETWLADTEKILDALPDLGIAGSVGMALENTWEKGGKGYIINRGEMMGNPPCGPEAVNTLDECVLIVPRGLFGKLQFDSRTFDGWHCYGCDYCLSAQEMGLKAYVIPAFVYHRSLSVNSKDLLKYQVRLYLKHRRHFPKICTTTGVSTGVRLAIAIAVEALIRVCRVLYWKRLRLTWIQIVAKELSDCDSVLDLGCGPNSPLQFCKVPYSLGVDIFDTYLEESWKKGLHSEYMTADLREVSFKPRSFDAVLCSEVLEHMTKEDGYKLLDRMDSWARKKVIITTPNGYIYQEGYDDNPFQSHTSGWTVSDLRHAGFKTRGMNSWKFLRGPKGVMKLRPIFFWELISEMTGQVTNFLPWLAFQLLAIRRVK